MSIDARAGIKHIRLGVPGLRRVLCRSFSRGLLATALTVLPRRLQLPIPPGLDLPPTPGQHVLRRDIADGAVQAVQAAPAVDLLAQGKTEYGAKHYTRAMVLFRLAAEQGSGDAMLFLGYMYQHGLGVRLDYAAAWDWDRRAASHGNLGAMRQMGYMDELGLGVPNVDYAGAMSWYRKAADLGLATSMNSIGNLDHEGHGVPVDNAAAMKWYQAAADRGEAARCCRLQPA
jgi:TPR repeat protein